MELAGTCPTSTLSDITGDGNRSSSNLTGKAIEFMAGKISCGTINITSQSHTLLPDQKLMMLTFPFHA